MSTGIDLAGDLMGMLAESVERGASMLAGGTRLAGPAAAQDHPSELVPAAAGDFTGLGLTFADGAVAVVALTTALAEEICGGTTPDHLRSALQGLVDEMSSGLGAALIDTIGLANSDEVVHFLADRPMLLGAGVFDGESVVATIGAAGQIDGGEPAWTDSSESAAPATDHGGPVGAPAPAPTLDSTIDPAPSPTSTPAAVAATPASRPPGPAVSDDILARGLALLADVNLEVTAELGRSHLRVSELLALEPGSVIGLERAAGSPVDLLVNGSLFARAEVIAQDGHYAVRITELVGTVVT